MGRALGVEDSTAASKYVQVNYISTLVTQKVFVAPFACIVTGITGATRVAGSGGACTAILYKTPDTIAPTSSLPNLALHSGSFNLVGTADTNQALTLATNPSTLTLKTGDAISYVLTGTATSAVGTVTITVEPIA